MTSMRNGAAARMRTYTDQPGGDQPCCGRCGQPIRSCGLGEGFEHIATGPDGAVAAVEADHVAWWDTTAGLPLHSRVTDGPA